MRTSYRLLTRGFVLLILAVLVQAPDQLAGQGKGKGGGGSGKPVSVPVEITFDNSEGDRILSVGGATYTDGQEGVGAFIAGSNGWVNMDTCEKANRKSPCASTGRFQLFDYTQHVGGPNLNEVHVAGGHWTIHPRDAALAHLPGGFRDIMNYPGETRIAGMKVNYSVVYPDGFVDYTTRFAPLMYPDSNFVLVTFLGGVLDCTTDTEGDCASWSVEAFQGTLPAGCCPEDQLDDIAELVTWDNSLDFGSYHMPFRLTVTVLPQ